MLRFTTAVVLISLLTASCAPSDSGTADDRRADAPPPPGTITRGDASTDLETAPVSAADYAMYAAIMGGASAMLANLSSEDQAALAFAKKVDAGEAKPTPQTEPLLARARALQQKDIEIARLQGIEQRYVVVKSKIEAVIGPNAGPPADPLAKENLRFLEAHRDNIERLQKIVRDPLSRPPQS